VLNIYQKTKFIDDIDTNDEYNINIDQTKIFSHAYGLLPEFRYQSNRCVKLVLNSNNEALFMPSKKKIHEEILGLFTVDINLID